MIRSRGSEVLWESRYRRRFVESSTPDSAPRALLILRALRFL
ncbi:hypothetical protein ACOQFL_06600 [Actinopolyspora sp. H202]